MGAPEVAEVDPTLLAFVSKAVGAAPIDVEAIAEAACREAGRVLADLWHAKARAFRASADASRAEGNAARAGYERLDAHRAEAVADEIARLCGSPAAPLDGDTE